MAKEKKAKSESSVVAQFNSIGRIKKSLGLLTNGEIGFKELRNLASNNPIVAVAINKIKNRIKTKKISIRLKKEVDADEEAYKKEMQMLQRLFDKPNQANDTWSKVISKVLEDVLIFDYGVIEKQKNALGGVVGMYHVDGSTIVENRDEYGILPDQEAYYQIIDNVKVATFDKGDLLIFQNNPRPEIDSLQKGRSPVEVVLYSVVSGLQALMYNTKMINSNTLPPALANLQGWTDEQVVEFAQAFQNQVTTNPHQTVFTNAENFDIKMLRPTNQEMQFYELNLWLTRIVISAFDLSPIDFGLMMDANRSNSQSQQEISDEGAYNVYTNLILDELTVDLLGDLDTINPKYADLEFYIELTENEDPKVQAEIHEIYSRNSILDTNEIRQKLGYEAKAEKTTENLPITTKSYEPNWY
jgi:hypothetical protein